MYSPMHIRQQSKILLCVIIVILLFFVSCSMSNQCLYPDPEEGAKFMSSFVWDPFCLSYHGGNTSCDIAHLGMMVKDIDP